MQYEMKKVHQVVEQTSERSMNVVVHMEISAPIPVAQKSRLDRKRTVKTGFKGSTTLKK